MVKSGTIGKYKTTKAKDSLFNTKSNDVDFNHVISE